MTEKELFKKLIGKWKGDVKTWFEPGKLADESTVVGEFTPLLEGKFIRHSYSLRGQKFKGSVPLNS